MATSIAVVTRSLKLVRGKSQTLLYSSARGLPIRSYINLHDPQSSPRMWPPINHDFWTRARLIPSLQMTLHRIADASLACDTLMALSILLQCFAYKALALSHSGIAEFHFPVTLRQGFFDSSSTFVVAVKAVKEVLYRQSRLRELPLGLKSLFSWVFNFTKVFTEYYWQDP